MLGVAFSLTSAQVRLLIATAFDRRNDIGLPDGEHRDYVGTAKCLERRGLITHSNDREPTYVATPLGIALANAIADECREVVASQVGAADRAIRWKPVPKKQLKYAAKK